MSDYIKIDNSAAQVQDDLRTEGNVKLNTGSRIHYESIKNKIAFYQHISSDNYDASKVDFKQLNKWQKGTLYTFDDDNKLYLALENYEDDSAPSDDWRNQNIKIFTPEQYIKETYAEKENGIIFAEGEYRIKGDINNSRIPDNIPYFDKYGRNIEVSNEEPHSGIYKLKCSYNDNDNEFRFLFLIQEVYKLNDNNTVYQLLYEFYNSYEDIYIYSREIGEDWKSINTIPSDGYMQRNNSIIQPFSVNGANDLYNKLNNNKENISNKSQNISDSDDKYPTSGAVKRYVDNLKQKIEDNSVGKKTELGGEIFNDYEKNEARHNYSHAEGWSTLAGAKCFKFDLSHDYNIDEDYDELNKIGKYYLTSTEGIIQGLIYTAFIKDKFFDINGEVVSVGEDYIEVTNYKLPIDENGTNILTNENYILFPYESHLGTETIGHGTHAEGTNNIALSNNAHAEGRNTKAIGRHAHTEGYGTEATHIGHAEGLDTKAHGSITHSEGYKTISNGEVSHAEGYETIVEEGYGSHAEGFRTKVSASHGAHAEGSETESISMTTHTEGYKTFAGSKGFYIGSIKQNDDKTWTLYLSDNPLLLPSLDFDISGIKTGDIISINNNYKYDECSSVIEVNNSNWSIIVDSLPFTELIRDAEPSIVDITNPRAGVIDLGKYAHAEGYGTIALRNSAHAEGAETKAIGMYSHTEGRQTKAYYAAHAEGRGSEALGEQAHAEGGWTKALGNNSHSEGSESTAQGIYSHAEGQKTISSGNSAHSEGKNTQAIGNWSHTEGNNTQATKEGSHAEGLSSQATANQSHAEGEETLSSGVNSHTEGYKTIASSSGAHAEGNSTQSSSYYTHAEGTRTKALAHSAHAEGKDTEASGVYSHAEGEFSKAIGASSHAEGVNTKTEGINSHAEGQNSRTTASATNAHAEGWSSVVSGVAAHAEGYSTAKGDYSHSEGERTIATARASHVCGKFNIEDTEEKYAYILGNGTGVSNRSNAYTVDWQGNGWYAKSVEAPTIYTNQVVLLSSGNKKFALKVKDDGTLYTEEVTN